MNVRLDHPGTGTDRAVLVLAGVAVAVAAVGLLVLLRATLAGMPGHRTVWIDNQTGLELRVDVVDGSGTSVGLGVARPRSSTAVAEAVDVGQDWTFVASYGGQEVFRTALSRGELASQGWTVRIPASATAGLERAGFR
jgi:lipoprotein-anchoring transpeptidase ErfK/SrfK